MWKNHWILTFLEKSSEILVFVDQNPRFCGKVDEQPRIYETQKYISLEVFSLELLFGCFSSRAEEVKSFGDKLKRFLYAHKRHQHF
jgi:hypothetical protein